MKRKIEELWQESRELSFGTSTTIESLNSPPSPLEFYRNFVSTNKPCIISNATLHWPALSLWSTNAYLSQTLSRDPAAAAVSVHITPDGRADALVPLPATDDRVVAADDDDRRRLCFASAHVEQMPFDRAIELVSKKSSGDDVENKFVAYAQQQNDCFRSEYIGLAADCELDIPWATEAIGCVPEAVNLWIGNHLSQTSFHKDHYENLYAVVTGEKHFVLLPPTDVHRMYIRSYPAAQYSYCEETGKFGLELENPVRYVPWCSVNPYPSPETKEREMSEFPLYFNGPKPFECTVKAGEILYLPSMWFHHVRQSPDSQGRTIAINYWYDMQFDVKYAYFNLLKSIPLHASSCQETEPDDSEQPQQKIATSAGETKSGKPKIKYSAMTELFMPEQVKEHIAGLRQWVGQSKAKAEKNQAMEHLMSENSCQLCAVEKLAFEPPPTYCSPCGARIKRNAMYYTMGTGDTRHYFCIPCYNESRGDTIVVDGNAIPKVKLEKRKNDEETEEWWVQCDKCEAWQHQICALFNGKRNDGKQVEYTCPNCYVAEVERGERNPLPQSAFLGAKDLPRTILSDQIEQRLFKRLEQERLERAMLHNKSYDEVPGAEALVVRVVSSVDKKLEVNQRFLETFQEENYPKEFPYKSKVVLLFQRIEGVEVCLFGMYVQEFGSECEFPNQRRVYLSYLDFVKYFRPQIRAVTGETLCTFVYHEILIGYLEYCKKRGFTSCSIWACPPLKGEDNLLYCHPEIQKTPKSDKLKEWYLAMLRKASKENIVVELTNLYDHYFLSTGECKARVTTARLPYFDGDYWPGAAEDMIYQLQQEEDGKRLDKEYKASGQVDLSGNNASKDVLLMQKLGETISSMKEDFIMVHLQHACTHCCILIVSGIRWFCGQCKNFHLCDKCYDAEQKREERDRHPLNMRDNHTLHPVEISDIPIDTKDKDDIIESEFFDTRLAFLSLCQGNHYQFDTLRRAKYSTMMVLYHLHNPTGPAFVITCTGCHLDIEAGLSWHCEVCPDYDICDACYKKDGGIDHPHELTLPSLTDRAAQNSEARQLRVLQLRKMLDLLVHGSQCRSSNCQYPHCRKVKGLFRHGVQCRVRASGGCVLCKKMWYLLQLHARACKESKCHVPRCRDLKEHLRRLQQQSDSRRRAAVMEMMRQRAAEVAGSSG